MEASMKRSREVSMPCIGPIVLPEAEAKLGPVLGAVLDAVKDIAAELRVMGTEEAESTASDGGVNAFGDRQLKADVRADEIMFAKLRECGAVETASSEENTDMVPMGGEGYSVAFDPIDGSSIYPANWAVGSIFGIWPGGKLLGRRGDEQVAAGFSVFGPRTLVVLARPRQDGSGVVVQELTLLEGKWVLTKDEMSIPENKKIFAPANMRASVENAAYRELIMGWMADKYTLRYSGGLVPDVYHIFAKGGGVFCNPVSASAPAKLRLLYEVAPLAFVVEAAGGSSDNGDGTVLALAVTAAEVRCSVVLGSAEEVKRCLPAMKASERGRGLVVSAAPPSASSQLCPPATPHPPPSICRCLAGGTPWRSERPFGSLPQRQAQIEPTQEHSTGDSDSSATPAGTVPRLSSSPATTASMDKAQDDMQRHQQDDHGNIALLEHININSDLPLESCTFFVDGLGFIHDARQGGLVDGRVYLDELIWFNAGMTQVHMPVTCRGAPGALKNKLYGFICIAYSDLEELCSRLAAVEAAGSLSHTEFSWEKVNDHEVHATDPNGNRWVATQRPEEERDTRGFHPGGVSLCQGISAIEFNVQVGSVTFIAEYYRRYFGAKVALESGAALVSAGPSQQLRFREKPGTALGSPEACYENLPSGLHICVYLYDQLSAMQRLAADNMLWGNPRYLELDAALGTSQFRCKDIMAQSSKTREPILQYELEHEVRTLAHSTSPFKASHPYTLLGREPVRELVSTITDEFERDFEGNRKFKMKRKKGFVPRPLGVCYNPIEVFIGSSSDEGANARSSCHQIGIILEELKLPYTVRSAAPQQQQQLIRSCNGELPEEPEPPVASDCTRGPVIRDPNQGPDEQPLAVSEAGAILLYLAERYSRGALIPTSKIGKSRCTEWLFFQAARLGPAVDQVVHDADCTASGNGSSESHDFHKQHLEDLLCVCGVMDAWLGKSEYIAGERFSIADIAVLSSMQTLQKQSRTSVLDKCQNVKRWYKAVMSRRAVVAGLHMDVTSCHP